LEDRWAYASAERAREGAAELVRLGVDVIVADGPISTLAAKEATRSTPIVMVEVDDPVALGVVSSLARPGGNVTGVAAVVPGGFYGKQLQLLKEVVPKASRIAVFRNPNNGAHSPGVMRELAGAAETLKVGLEFLAVTSYGELDDAFHAATRKRVGALLVLHDVIFFAGRQKIAQSAIKARLPAMYPRARYVDAGGLMSYGASPFALYQRAAAYVDRILKGAKPADLPVEQPTRFELVINLKTARALGLTIPQSVLFRADEVIK
jgi:putative ABC transport system substrate-binding protein